MNKLHTDYESHQGSKLDFREDWKKSKTLLRQAIEQAPIASVLLFASLAITLPKLAPAMIFIQSLAWLFLGIKLIRATYCEIVPQAQVHPDVFPTKRELPMYLTQLLFIIGTLACGVLLVIPGFWFAVVHSQAQQLVVLENCTIGAGFKRSRELLKGNIREFLGYVILWPAILLLAFRLILMIGNVIFALVLKFVYHTDYGRADLSLIELLVNYFDFFVYMRCTTLAVRAYVHFTHKSGNKTAIERQLNAQV